VGGNATANGQRKGVPNGWRLELYCTYSKTTEPKHVSMWEANNNLESDEHRVLDGM